MKRALKVKTQAKPERKPKSQIHGRQDNKPENLLLQRWRPELEELMSQRFLSVDAACDALISKVSERMSRSETVREELRHFLKDVFSMDPQLRDALAEMLDIQD